ncbi:MAG: histidine phosphatase family protein [Burkholderiales bacterium]
MTVTSHERARRILVASWIALAALLAPVQAVAAADERLWALLKGGGQVVMMRHALTVPGTGDPPGMRLDDCATQRNLSDEGRADARRAGDAFRARGIPVGRILSSPWCRCIETAELAFGRTPETSTALSNLFTRPQNRDKQVRAMQALVSARPRDGNLVLVSHGSTISALTGVYLGAGEFVVVTPLGGGKFKVAGQGAAH